MTMQRDRHLTMDADQRRTNDENPESKGGETGESKEHGTFSIASAERAHCMENFISVDLTPTRCLGTTFLLKSKSSFRKQSKNNGKEYSISRR